MWMSRRASNGVSIDFGSLLERLFNEDSGSLRCIGGSQNVASIQRGVG